MNKLIIIAAGCAAIAASLGSLSQAAVQPSSPTAVTQKGDRFEPRQAFSYELGSKKAVGFFMGGDNHECRLTVMLGENVDIEAVSVPSAARVTMSVGASRSAEVESEEASLRIGCSADAGSIQIERSAKKTS